jgi:hypothetical protein
VSLSASTAAWIAIAAAAIAVVAIAAAAACYTALRRVRASQLVLIGKGQGDLVDFAVSLQGRIDTLHRTIDDVAGALGNLERRVDGTIARSAIVRYDAYANSGGHQSSSVALLDASRSGIVLSAIQGRDYARIYIKELDRGKATVALSPEEQEAVDRAMAG